MNGPYAVRCMLAALLLSTASRLAATTTSTPAPTNKPPNIDIAVSKGKQTTESYGVVKQNMSFSVIIKNKEPSKAFNSLSARLYVFGKAIGSGSYILLDRSTNVTFNLPVNGKFNFSGEPFWCRNDSQDWGTKYEGYGVVVRDAEGNTLVTKTTKEGLLKNPKKLDDFSIRGTTFTLKSLAE